MNRKLHRIIALVALFVFSAFLLCSCNTPLETPPSSTSGDDVEISFTYETFSVPEICTAADSTYFYHYDSGQFLFTVNSYNGKTVGPMDKTDAFVLFGTSGDFTSFPIDTQACVYSAIPYEDGILYMDHNASLDNCQWFLTFTDGTDHLVLDSGTATSYQNIPSIFLLQGIPHYLYTTQSGFQVKAVEDGEAKQVYSHAYGDVVSVADVFSNGSQYCVMVNYPDSEYPTMLILNEFGVLYEHQLTGKICSFTITNQYAVCVSGDEETEKCAIEVIDLANGTQRVISQPYGPLWGLKGIGNVCVCVGNSWKAYSINLDSGEISSIAPPITNTKIHPRFNPINDSQFFVTHSSGDVFQCYLLNLSKS